MAYTHESFLRKIGNRFDGIATITSEFKGIHNRISLRCACGEDYTATANNLLHRGSAGCPKCAKITQGMKKRSNHEAFAERVCQRQRTNITLLTPFTRYADPMLALCDCGHYFAAKASALASGKGCIPCYRKRIILQYSMTHEEFVRRVDAIGVFAVEGQFVNTKTHVLVRCLECGHSTPIIGGNIIGKQASGCLKCGHVRGGLKGRLSEATVKAMIAEMFDGTLIPTGKYEGTQKPYWVRCTKCDKHFQRNCADFIYQCSGCTCSTEWGFKDHEPAIWYYVRFDLPGLSLYKGGVTGRTVKARFKSHKVKPVELKKIYFDLGSDAWEYEQQILRENAFDLYRGPDLLLDGNDELFVCDVLGLDTGDTQLELGMVA